MELLLSLDTMGEEVRLYRRDDGGFEIAAIPSGETHSRANVILDRNAAGGLMEVLMLVLV